MKHCQITGVEMPDDNAALTEAAERYAWDKGIPHLHRHEPAWHYSIIDFKAGAAYRDALITLLPETFRKQCNDQANEASAEFPNKEFLEKFDRESDEPGRGIMPLNPIARFARWGFERGRTIIAWDVVTEPLTDKIADLEAKLAEAQAEIERLKSRLDTQA